MCMCVSVKFSRAGPAATLHTRAHVCLFVCWCASLQRLSPGCGKAEPYEIGFAGVCVCVRVCFAFSNALCSKGEANGSGWAVETLGCAQICTFHHALPPPPPLFLLHRCMHHRGSRWENKAVRDSVHLGRGDALRIDLARRKNAPSTCVYVCVWVFRGN